VPATSNNGGGGSGATAHTNTTMVVSHGGVIITFDAVSSCESESRAVAKRLEVGNDPFCHKFVVLRRDGFNEATHT